MIPFASRLDDLDFDRLVEIARGRLPALAPQWTDYNIHDPGITLVELLGWIADSQIYSLARNRRDERLAMAALLGVAPRGAIPARGTLYPAAAPESPIALPAGRRILPVRARAPRVEIEAAVDLLPLTIDLVTLHEDGSVTDVTRINERARASFEPFGAQAAPGAELRLRLKRADGAAPLAGRCRLSLGVQSAIAGEGAPRLGDIEAILSGVGPLERLFDASANMQRSGAMVFAVEDAARLAGGEIVLRPRQPAALVPKLMRIDVNAIPVRQRATFSSLPFRGNGRPGQTMRIVPRECFGSDEMPAADDTASPPVWRLVHDARPALRVRTAGGEAWHAGRLDEAGPKEACFESTEAPDGSEIAIRFGNGINGRKPGLEEPLELSLALSCGARGNVATSLDWLVDAVRVAVRNRDPLVGGADAEDVGDALARARRRLRDERLLATSAQLRQAVKTLPAPYGIGRVEVEDGWERGRRAPASVATRSLIVSREAPGTETEAWLRAVDRAVRPRIALGERLAVIAPVYRRFDIRLQADFAARVLPAQVREAVENSLRERFETSAAGGSPWPMGRDVDATAIAGWVRRVEGVARVGAVVLVEKGGMPQDRLELARGELPLLDAIQWQEAPS